MWAARRKGRKLKKRKRKRKTPGINPGQPAGKGRKKNGFKRHKLPTSGHQIDLSIES
jgi:hypothetical protein